MTAHILYERLKSWQTGIGALLGFVALMVAALWNFHLNRKRDAALRREEVASIAAAFYGEIVLLRVEAAALARVVANVYIASGTERDPAVKFDVHIVAAHQISEPILYGVLASKLGFLPPEMVLGIAKFYRDIREASHLFPLLIENPDRGYGYNVTSALVPLCDAVADVLSTMRAIEKMVGIREPAKSLEIGNTEGVIVMEEENNAQQ